MVRSSVVCISVMVALVLWWAHLANGGPNNSQVVIYFGVPWDVVTYALGNWAHILYASMWCFFTAIISLLLAGAIAVALLIIGMRSDRRLARIERAVAVLQTVPTLIIVTVSLLIEREVLRVLGVRAPVDVFCIIPVALSLVFAPLVYGINGINQAPLVMKAMLRIWNAKPWWRIWRVYLPYITSDVMTGLRASATWALGAVLIAEGLMNGVDGDSQTLGRSLIRPFSGNQPGQTVAVIIVSIALGFLVYYVTKRLHEAMEQRLYGEPWANHQLYPLQTPKQAN